uniref:Uncharacterized protein n=1 Tax=Meloidogyne enterolobii TaxID=390850 RepID=A0A6V7X0P6_MELEN|nr:unnamed protein product [Meloidogyne enterolobii]
MISPLSTKDGHFLYFIFLFLFKTFIFFTIVNANDKHSVYGSSGDFLKRFVAWKKGEPLQCPCGYKRILDSKDVYKNHKSFETEHFDTKIVFDFVGAGRFSASGPTKIIHLFSLTNGKCKLEVEYYFKKAENISEQENNDKQMSKLFEKFVKVALLKKNPLNVAKLTDSRLLRDSTGKVDSAFKPNKLLFDEAKMVAPLEEFLRYRIRYIFFNEKRQGKKWESDLGMDVILTEIMKGMKEISDVTGFEFEKINLNDFIVVKNKQGHLSVKFIYIHDEGTKKLEKIFTKEGIKKSLKLNKLVNDEAFKFYKLILEEKESFIETKKRVIKGYGKLFWLKLFMQMFIKSDNLDKSLISSYLIPRTCLYALSGNLNEFKIKGKDDDDFLFKTWQEFVKGEKKPKTKSFENFDELLGNMFGFDWLNNCEENDENNLKPGDRDDDKDITDKENDMDDKENEEKNEDYLMEDDVNKDNGMIGKENDGKDKENDKKDKEDEDKVTKCVNKIKERLKKEKENSINNEKEDHILNILLKLLDEFLIASSGEEFNIIFPDISENKFPKEAFTKDESSIFKSLEIISKKSKKIFIGKSPYNEIKDFNINKEAKSELKTYNYFNNCWINLTMSEWYEHTKILESIFYKMQVWVDDFTHEHNFNANDDFYDEN